MVAPVATTMAASLSCTKANGVIRRNGDRPIELGDFLGRGKAGPEHQALSGLIGSLVDEGVTGGWIVGTLEHMPSVPLSQRRAALGAR